MSISPAAIQELLKSRTGERFIVLLTIDHSSFTEPARVALNNEDVVSNSITYLAGFFKINLPANVPKETSTVTLEIQNVDRAIIDEIRSIQGTEPDVELRIVSTLDPDNVEMGPLNFKMRSAEYDAVVISATLAFEDVLNQRFPADTFNPRDFPNIFQ